jgi:hypothetical protein
MKPRADKKTGAFALAFLEMCSFTSAAWRAQDEVCAKGIYQIDLKLILVNN